MNKTGKSTSRRDFFKKSGTLALGALAATALSKHAMAGTEFFGKNNVLPEAGKFMLPSLPYPYDALQPHIDKLTMEIHHTKHHQAYVTNLNKSLEGVDAAILPDQNLETLLANVSKFPPAVRNNAGGHYNHSLFWTMMKPNGTAMPGGALERAINKEFVSVEEFKNKFSEAAKTVFGSGWIWLVFNNGKLDIGTTPNQDNPMMDTSTFKGKPLLALDVWEHAYYLKHQNKRADYISTWWNVVNWEKVNDLYKQATTK